MEAKTLLRLIKNDIAHLEEITHDFEMESLPSADEVEVALVHAKALLRELELLTKLTCNREKSSEASVSAPETKVRILEFSHSPQEQIKLSETKTNDISDSTPAADRSTNIPDDIEVPIETGTAKTEKDVVPEISDSNDELLADKTDKGGKTLGESLGESHQMVNDILSQEKHESGYKIMPINSIWDGIGINDRFLFIRELFGNNSEQFESAVNALDGQDNIHNAVNYLKTNFKWHKAEASQKFLALVKRRFTN